MALDLGPGERFGEFEIVEVAGRGGMGVVYRAVQVSLGRTVALKVIAASIADREDFRARFSRESRMAASVEHPNVVTVYGTGEVDGSPYMAMRWIDGSDLRSILGSGPLEPERALAVGRQMAEALEAVHEAGLVHRDVKPANVILARTARGEHAYLTDFGIAKLPQTDATDLTRAGHVLGTMGYMAPEQIRGVGADARSDLYALACLVFECLTGEPPFRRDNDIAVGWAHMNEARPLVSQRRPELGDRFDAVLARGMAVEPAERYQTEEEFAGALESVPDEPTRLRPPGSPTAPTTPLSPGHELTVPDAEPPPPPPPSAPAPPPPYYGTPEPTYGEPDRTRQGPNRVLVAVLAALLLAGVAVGVVAAAGGFSSGSTKTTTVDDGGGSGGGGGGSSGGGETSAAQDEVVSVLRSYESAYSNQDTDALGTLMTDGVTRHGLRAGGCSTVSGKPQVLETYSEQFAAGSGTYRLTDLSRENVAVNGDSASLSSGYTISPGGSGSVDFALTRSGDTWLISKIDASC